MYQEDNIKEFESFLGKLNDLGKIKSPGLMMIEYLKISNHFADIKQKAYEEGFQDGLKKWEEGINKN
jgi:hypothetical protein